MKQENGYGLQTFGLLRLQLKGTARYKGLLLAPAEGFDLQSRHFWPLANPFLAFSQGLDSRLELWLGNPSTVHP